MASFEKEISQRGNIVAIFSGKISWPIDQGKIFGRLEKFATITSFSSSV